MLSTAALAPCSGPTGTRAGIAGPRGMRALPRCGWAPSGDAGSVARERERVPSTPAARSRRPAARRAGRLLTALLRGSGAAGLIASRHSPISYLRRDPTHLRLYESASLTFSPIADALVAYCMALPAAVAPETSSNLPVLTS